MVVGGGTLLVPKWLRGLVQLLMATVVRIISNSGSMAMVAKILSLMMDNSEVLAEDKEYMKAIANRVTVSPPTVTAGCTCGRAPWAPKPMRGVAKEGRPRSFANDHRGVGQWTGVWKSQWAHVPGPQGFLRCVEETHVKCELFHKAEPLPMCAS